jgi:hypothetical protein
MKQERKTAIGYRKRRGATTWLNRPAQGVGCALALLAALGGCNRHEAAQPNSERHKPQPAVSPWTPSDFIDPMTDVQFHAFVTPELHGAGTLQIYCTDKGLTAIISSDFFLSIQRKNIQYRYDDNKAVEVDVFVNGKDALLYQGKSMKDRSEPILKYISELGAQLFFLEGQSGAARRLRIRLISISGQLNDLQFDVTGMGSRLDLLRKNCKLPI